MTREDLEKMYGEDDEVLKGRGLARKRWVTLQEANVLADVVEEEAPDHIFESGTANGYSTSWLGLLGTPVTTYDIVNRAKVWGERNPAHITCVNEKFSSMVEHAKTVEGKKLFFIDGNHNSSGVKADVEAVLEVIEKGDVIVFHDLNCRAVIRFWHRLAGDEGREVHYKETKYDTQRGMGKLVFKGVGHERKT